MKYQYESVKHQIDIPIKIFTQTVEQFPYHWHEDMEILLVLEGSLEIRIDKTPYTLVEGDLFLVNASELHFIKSSAPIGKTKLLALQFNHEYFQKFGIEIEKISFYLHSEKLRNENALLRIRFLLAEMMDLVLNKPNLYNIKVEKSLIELITLILEHFQVEQKSVVKADNERLLEILKYINDHCMDSQMNIKVISEHFYLNPQYLSRYFKDQVGLSLKKFIDKTRLTKSLVALKTSEERVLDIALKYGFPDAKSYYRVFKENYDCTPMKYRELHKLVMDKGITKDYFSINSQESLKRLFRYLDEPTKEIQKSFTHALTINLNKVTKPFKKNVNKIATFGYAVHGLRKDFMEQLSVLQRDIDFEYLRFHGIFSDELLVYNENFDGSYYFNFNHIDQLLDNLISVDIKPYIELGFMPKQLASNEMTVFNYQCNVSPPKSYEIWAELIEAFMKHLINRYSLETILEWRFEFWNEPEIETAFWSGTRKEFFDLYKITFETIKAIHSDIQVGGFGNAMFIKDDWLKEFNDYALENSIHLDFFSFHVYNIQIEGGNHKIKELIGRSDKSQLMIDHIEMSRHGVTIGDEKHVERCIDDFIEEVKNYNAFSKSYWITEWNANTDSRDLVHDTTYMAAYIVKHVLQNTHKVEGMGFWTFTDIFEEQQLEAPLFHGGFGLMTYNGLRKPAYHAYQFLSQLGNQVIYQDNFILVSKEGENYQVLLYNYSHPNRLYSTFDYSQINMLDRYKVFMDGQNLFIDLILTGIQGNYQVTEHRCNRKEGSVFDAWVEMGAPKILSSDAYAYLEAKSHVGIKTYPLYVDHDMKLQTNLTEHEIQLITIKKIY